MVGNFETCLNFVLRPDIEGGYSDNNSDPGGVTNLGVTLATWQSWVGHAVTPDEMKALTPADVSPLYHQRYWQAVHGDDLPAGVDLCLFDSAVNQGPGTAAKMLQQVMLLAQDGIIGPHTLQALSEEHPVTVIPAFCEARIARYRQNPQFDIFGKGWLARVDKCQTAALAMITGA